MVYSDSKIVFDMCYTKGMRERFFEQYGYLDKYDKEIFDDDERMKLIIKQIVTKKMYDTVDFINHCNTIYKIGDNVKVNFIPYSQKNIEQFEERNFEGILFYIDNKSSNALFIQTINYEIEYAINDNQCVEIQKQLAQPYYMIRSIEQFCDSKSEDTNSHHKYSYYFSK